MVELKALAIRSVVTVGLAAGASLTPANAATQKPLACHSENEHMTLSGILTFPKGINARTEHPYSYPLLKLDKPLCYRDTEMGDVPKAQKLALLPDESALHQFDGLAGRRITVKGLLIHSSTTDQPPQDLLLFEAMWVR